MPETFSTEPISNFGGNLHLKPASIFVPQNEGEVLEILARVRGRKIRTIGRLHSWSEASQTDDVLIDLRNLNEVRIQKRNDEPFATVGAGCQIKRLLAELERQADLTLPSLGLITEQTIAGATATGTHGSGKNSLSHYVEEVRVATYDAETGEPVIRVISDGDELRAARCSLGCLGVIVSVGFRPRPQYNIEEHFYKYKNLDDVLTAEDSFPLQQFFLVPWLWKYFAQHRREAPTSRSLRAGLYRAYFFCTFDIAFHLILLAMTRLFRSRSLIRFFYRFVMPLTVIRGWRVIDRSSDQLVMEHELFRHIEIEVFVTRSRLREALSFVEQLLRHAGGQADAITAESRDRLASHELVETVESFQGGYTHHYPICVRSVLPDDTLISMASGGEESHYAISFISYARPDERKSFFAFAEVLCHTMSALFDARPHWGKVCPLTPTEAERLYPRLSEFRAICEAVDPDGVFRNDWAENLLFETEPHK